MPSIAPNQQIRPCLIQVSPVNTTESKKQISGYRLSGWQGLDQVPVAQK
jgi:hypothetical protein